MSTDRATSRIDGAPAVTTEQRRAAKVLGFLYVIQMAVAVFSQIYVRDRLIVRGDEAKTAQNILAHELLFRLSIAGDLFVYAGVIVLMWCFYVVVRPVNKNLALLAVLFRIAETAVLCAATVASLVVLRLLAGGESLESFSAGQMHSLAALALSAQGSGMYVGFILLGLGSALFAWLLWKSRYVPRLLALLGVFAASVMAVVTFADLVFPRLGEVLGIAYMAPMGVYEVSLGLWLLFRPLREPAGALRFSR